MNLYLVRIKNWVKENPVEALILVIILIVGAILRLYKIDQYMTFLGDEGRDVIIVRRIFTELHPPLIGPGTSVGNLYLGPLYYYLMAPALFLAGFSPVGPAIQVAVLGVITIFLVWYVARDWFFPKEPGQISWSALIAAGLYSVSTTVIVFSRSSWNPNIMPFFALLSIYSIWKVWQKREYKWLIVLGVSFAFILQSHYLGLLLLPVLIIFWFLTFRAIENRRLFLKSSLIGFSVFIILMSPLFIFDLRHNWMNLKAAAVLFNKKENGFVFNPVNTVKKLPETSSLITRRLLTGRVDNKTGITSILALFLIGILVYNWRKLQQEKKKSLLLLATWLGFGIIGLTFYQGEIYDHYFGFLFPAPFLLLGFLIENGKNSYNPWQLRYSSFIVAIYFFGISVFTLPFKSPPVSQLARAKDVADKILAEANGNKFNLAVLAETNYEDGYRYFLELYGGTVLHADKWHSETISDQLFVVCEMPKEKCDPTHSPKAEVANFGMSKIEDEWEVDGVVIYKLGHTK